MKPTYTDERGQPASRPASIIDAATGLRVAGPSDEQLARAGIYRAEYREPDEGLAVLGHEFRGIIEGRAVYEPITMDAREFVAANRRAVVAGMIAQHQTQIMQLAALLGRFGLTMPISTDEATAAIYAAAKAETDPAKALGMTLDAVLLANVRSGLPMADALLYDCAVAMQQEAARAEAEKERART